MIFPNGMKAKQKSYNSGDKKCEEQAL